MRSICKIPVKSVRNILQKGGYLLKFKSLYPALCYNSFMSHSASKGQQEKYSLETMKKLKKDAKEFAKNEVLVEEGQEHILEMKKPDEWKKFVLENKKPVIILCYAHWSKQSIDLVSVLEPKVRSYKGALNLVKMNIDLFPQIATALKVKTVPTVFLISGGNAIDGFMGVPEPNVLNHFYSTVDTLCGVELEEQDMKKTLQEAKDFVNKGEYESAAIPLNKILENERWTNKFGGQAYAMLSLISIKKGKKEEALECLAELNTKFSDQLKSEEVRGFVDKVNEILAQQKSADEQNPKITELENVLKANPQDLNSRYSLAELYMECGNFEKSIGHLLDIMKIDRNWEEKKANNLIISIFGKLGSTDKLVIDSRKKMQRMLY